MSKLILERQQARWYPLIEHPVQLSLMGAVGRGVRFPVVPAGRRSGKTERAKRFLAKQAMENANEKYFAAAPTYNQAKKIWWDDLKMLTLSVLHLKKPSESALIIYLPNGTEIHILGLDQPQRIEGINWTGGVIDEIADIKAEALEANIMPALNTYNPTRPEYRAWCWFIGVPDGLNHYYEMAEYAKTSGDPDYELFHWKSEEILPADVIASAKRTMSRKQYNQEYAASFETASGRIYEDYDGKVTKDQGGSIFSPGKGGEDDPILMGYEAWSRADARIYTLIDGCTKQFARAPYTPQLCGERWWPYFILPFQSVDGEFAAQSLVDVLERLQEEHNETRDKFAEVRRNIRPSFIFSGDVKDKDITKRIHPELGEYFAVKTEGGKLTDYVQQATQLTIDPAVYDTSPIRNDWEQVSGLSDAARSVVVSPKTATEASISDQSLAARVAEFRDQIEDFLTEIAQYASELCLLAMTPAQVETIMGKPADGAPPTFFWPEQRTPDTVFNLIQMRIRSGSTAAPNKLQMQENWAKAMPLLRELGMVIRQLEASGADATPERELVKETAARFDETIDVDRFLPPKPAPKLPMPMMPGMPAPGGLPIPPQGPAPMNQPPGPPMLQ